MKYEVFINGGFAKLPNLYKGEIYFGKDEKIKLLKELQKETKPSNEINDGYEYHIKFIDKNTKYEGVYYEHKLPKQLREFLDAICLKK